MSNKAKPGIRWSTHFFIERPSRGYVEAGIRETDIRVHVAMTDDEVERSRKEDVTYERTAQPDSIWGQAMKRCEDEASCLVRQEWKKSKKTTEG